MCNSRVSSGNWTCEFRINLDLTLELTLDLVIRIQNSLKNPLARFWSWSRPRIWEYLIIFLHWQLQWVRKGGEKIYSQTFVLFPPLNCKMKMTFAHSPLRRSGGCRSVPRQRARICAAAFLPACCPHRRRTVSACCPARRKLKILYTNLDFCTYSLM